MADIVRRIPWQLNNFEGSTGGGSYSLQDYQFDYAVGGIPFLSATRDSGGKEWPYTERMAEIRKEQFDNFAEPGEQSIYGWWLRSQSTFTAGAGILYQDPDNDNQFNYRFANSLGVNPWVSGDLSLLRESTNKATISAATSYVRGFVDGTGADAAWYSDGQNLWKMLEGSNTVITTTGMGVVLGLTSTGSRYIAAADDGIWTGVDGGAATNVYTYSATTSTVSWVKGRIAVSVNNALYLAPLATTPQGPIAAAPGVVTAYTHPSASWAWASITEGPNAIYAAGNDGTTGAIFRFTLTDAGATVGTYVGTVSAQLPTGERVNSIYGYIGSFIGIATSKGFRVGQIDGNGDVVYGPLLFEIENGCSGITGFDRFLWTGSTNAHDDQSGLYRIDLGSTIQEQTTQAIRYAYARDIYATGITEPIVSVDMFGSSDRKVFSIPDDSVWLEESTTLLEEGYLDTGRIRYNTEEPKLYKFVSLRCPIPLQGEVSLSVLSQTGQVIPYITYGPTFGPGTGDVATPEPFGTQNWIALRFTLRRGDDPAFGGVLNGWQVKALPGSIRQRLISTTFLCLDRETDKGGQNMGHDGYARERLQAFQALARAGDVVVYQELMDSISTLVIIDDWQYTQYAPPGPNGQSLGGFLTVVLRTVAEST